MAAAQMECAHQAGEQKNGRQLHADPVGAEESDAHLLGLNRSARQRRARAADEDIEQLDD